MIVVTTTVPGVAFWIAVRLTSNVSSASPMVSPRISTVNCFGVVSRAAKLIVPTRQHRALYKDLQRYVKQGNVSHFGGLLKTYEPKVKEVTAQDVYAAQSDLKSLMLQVRCSLCHDTPSVFDAVYHSDPESE